MRLSLALLLAAASGACGPAVRSDEAGSSTTGPSGAAASTSSTDDGSVQGTSSSTSASTTGPEPATSGTTGEMTTAPDETTGDENDSSDTPPCTCPTNVEVGFGEMVNGTSAAEEMARYTPFTIPFYWLALPGAEPTEITVSASYAGGSVAVGPGGSNGCAFLSDACLDGFLLDVEVEVTTADGRLDASFPASLTLSPEESGYPDGFSEVLTGAQVNSSFFDLGFEDDGTALDFDAIRVGATWTTPYDGPVASISAAMDDDTIHLGWTYPPKEPR